MPLQPFHRSNFFYQAQSSDVIFILEDSNKYLCEDASTIVKHKCKGTCLNSGTCTDMVRKWKQLSNHMLKKTEFITYLSFPPATIWNWKKMFICGEGKRGVQSWIDENNFQHSPSAKQRLLVCKCLSFRYLIAYTWNWNF